MNSIRGVHQKGDSSDWKIPPFWQKLNSFFLFPLQTEPLLYALLLSACSYGLMFGWIGVLFVGLGLMLAVKCLIDERMKKRRAEAAVADSPAGETGNVS